jgi:hypothetical protein
MDELEDQLLLQLRHIAERVQWMANAEARAAWVQGLGTNGEFWAEKKRLLDETDKILDRIMEEPMKEKK